MSTLHFNHQTFLPHCHANHASTQLGLKFKLCGESFLFTPKSAIIDGLISYGGSTGVGFNLPRKAYGEFFERNHLFTKIPVHSKKKLSEIEPVSFREKLLGLCDLSRSSAHACLNHEFLFTKVENIFDNSVQDYFYNTIALNGNKEDSVYINFSDSCACAAHPVKEKAIYNSVMEFLERQALLGSWMSKTYQYAINPELLLTLTPYAELAEILLSQGSLYIVQNGNKLPGHTVIIFYFAKSDRDSVQYSIGSSSGLTIQEALTSALAELYQCYSFLYNMESSSGLENKAGAGYHLSFQQCNHQGVRQTIPFLDAWDYQYQINNLDDVQSLKNYSYEEILADLKTISDNIYYYHGEDKALGLHMTKLMSPDFFGHMSLNKHLNFQCAYAQRMGITKENAYLNKIPFP